MIDLQAKVQVGVALGVIAIFFVLALFKIIEHRKADDKWLSYGHDEQWASAFILCLLRPGKYLESRGKKYVYMFWAAVMASYIIIAQSMK